MEKIINPKEYIFGANILENLTTGMYKDSKVIYREYIQNSCDAIDKAVEKGLLTQKDSEIKIWLDAEKRNVTIEDNGTGIRVSDFVHTLADIAYSDKKLGEEKGFRGIGRLCGLAYCEKLVFSTKAAGENIISFMYCDALKMRELIGANERGDKHTASDVLHAIFTFDQQTTDDLDSHWFKVELINVNKENNDLLNIKEINDYLSFVAPVPYQNTFYFRQEVYNYAKQLEQQIDEYTILLEGEQIFKKYKNSFKTSKGKDEILKLYFKKISDSKNNLIAWLWYGVSNFKAVILSESKMRGLRLRKDNIQIGNEDALQKLFKEDRGNHYFVGEVFAISKDLIPNSQRDYFNENSTRNDFEKQLGIFFSELHKIYYGASSVNSAAKSIEDFTQKEEEFKKKLANNDFIDESDMNQAKENLKKCHESAIKARKKIEKEKQNDKSFANKVIGYIINQREKDLPQEDKLGQIEETNGPILRRVNKLSAYNKKERKLISKIFSIILSATDQKTAEVIISKIEVGLQ